MTAAPDPNSLPHPTEPAPPIRAASPAGGQDNPLPATEGSPPASPPPSYGVPARSRFRPWLSLVAAVVLAVCGYAAGFAAQRAGMVPGPGKRNVESYRQEIRARVDQPAWTNLGRIYKRNFLVFFILCVGIGTAGILTLVQIFWLGASVGMDVGNALAAGVDGRLIFWFTFPHGVPEISAFCIAASVGLHGTLLFLRYLRGGTLLEPDDLRPLLRRTLLGLVLLAIAGPVEVFLTPALGSRYL